MGDIDFDELDKAVHSLTESTAPKQKSEGPRQEAAVSVSSKPASQPVALATATPSTRHHAEPIHAGQPQRPVRISRPLGSRRGRSMDIVTARPVSREAAKVQPLDRPVVVPATPAAHEPQAESTETPAHGVSGYGQPQAQVVSSRAFSSALTEASPASQPTPAVQTADQWPDPLEFHGFSTHDNADSPADATASNASEPQPSPFLTDAKVKKRPLGAFATNEQPPQQTPATVMFDYGAAEPAQGVAGVALEAPAPGAQPQEPPAMASAPEPTSQSTLQKAAAMAIPQQYRTANAPADTSHRPVFDTTEYHPPLLEAHSHHKSHGTRIGLVLALLSIATLVAVGGYLVFIFVTQG